MVCGLMSAVQVLIWDTRDKNTPVNRTNLTEGHSFPVYALACIPAVNTLHHIIRYYLPQRDPCSWRPHHVLPSPTHYGSLLD